MITGAQQSANKSLQKKQNVRGAFLMQQRTVS